MIHATQKWEIGDCIELMRELPDNKVDLVFADPPFNVGKDYGCYTNDNRPDYFDWCKEWIFECFRVLKPTGSFYHMNLVRNLSRLLPMMDEHGELRNLIPWRNVCSWGSKRSFYSKYQPIMFYTKTNDYTFNTYAQREPLTKRWGKTSGKIQGQMGDMWMDIPFVWAGSIHHPEAILKPGTNSKLHPAQMPVKLVERAILFSTDEYDTVLDPFLGIGTSLEAGRRTNRNVIGFEINPQWEEHYPDRCKSHTPQLTTYFGDD